MMWEKMIKLSLNTCSFWIHVIFASGLCKDSNMNNLLEISENTSIQKSLYRNLLKLHKKNWSMKCSQELLCLWLVKEPVWSDKCVVLSFTSSMDHLLMWFNKGKSLPFNYWIFWHQISLTSKITRYTKAVKFSFINVLKY